MSRNRRNSRKKNSKIQELIRDKKYLKRITITLIIVIIAALATIVTKVVFDTMKMEREKELLAKELPKIFVVKDFNDPALDANVVGEERAKQKDENMIHIAVVGDILCEESMLDDARRDNGTYDFNYMFDQTKEITSSADITIGTFETNLVSSLPYNDTNAPDSYAEAIYKSGIDLVSSATNHSLDYGVDALRETNNTLQRIGFDYVGTSNEANGKKYLIKEVKGAKIAFLGYTYGIGAKYKGEDANQYINLYSNELAAKEIAEVKDEADFICVIMHWGDVDSLEANDIQRAQAQFLTEQGVDLIVGSHAAVVQPMEMKKGTNNKDVFVSYSLGNYVSALGYKNSDLEVVINVEISKDKVEEKDNKEETKKKEPATIKKVDYTPLYFIRYTHKDKEQYKLVDLRDVCRKFQNGNELIDRNTYDKLIAGDQLLQEIVTKK